MDQKKLWSGRFQEATDEKVEAFTASVGFDWRLYPYDISGSIIHATMLERVGILSQEEKTRIIDGLEQVKQEIEEHKFQWSVQLEDVHMNIEARLTELIGDTGKKLHTARSRNDQVATDMRLYLRDHIDKISEEIESLIEVLLNIAEREAKTVMPGFTHLQSAQPVSFGHHMMAWVEMLLRDMQRFQDCRKRVNVMPLGSAALAGTSFPIDREFVAKELGFDRPCSNSLDGVSDRDFVIEFLSVASLTMVHLSRFSEELVLWVSSQFDFVELPDAFCTGSSIMPQKKNPDVPELVRGKSGRVVGQLVTMLMLMKGQVLAYNKDNQEDKEPLFDAVDTLLDSLSVYAAMMSGLKVNQENLRAAAEQGYSTATDLADYLVRQGLPFRDAHEVVGKLVHFGISNKKMLGEMTLDELKSICPQIETDVFQVLSLEGSMESRSHIGGTAPDQVRKAVKEVRKQLKNKNK